MIEDLHKRAERLITESLVDQISDSERDWLKTHLEECPRCSAIASATEASVRSLRSMPVQFNPVMLRATRLAVYQRALELNARRKTLAWIWLAAALSWAWMAVSTPYIWRAVEWIAGRLAIPKLIWQMGFGLWWVLPALAVAAVLSELRPRQAAAQDIAITMRR